MAKAKPKKSARNSEAVRVGVIGGSGLPFRRIRRRHT